jgi:hypothetical protein
MHKAGKFIRDLYYGFDQHNLYFRLDAEQKLAHEKQGMVIDFEFHDGTRKAAIEFGAENNSVRIDGMEPAGVKLSAGDILEAAVPFPAIQHLSEGMEIKCAVFVKKNGSEIQRIPEKGFLRISLPDRDFELYNWKA